MDWLPEVNWKKIGHYLGTVRFSEVKLCPWLLVAGEKTKVAQGRKDREAAKHSISKCFILHSQDVSRQVTEKMKDFCKILGIITVERYWIQMPDSHPLHLVLAGSSRSLELSQSQWEDLVMIAFCSGCRTQWTLR